MPGGCSLKRPDALFEWSDRYVQIDVDEEGHAGTECDVEEARLEVVAADLDQPGLVIRINPDQPACFRRRQLRNGETALEANGYF